MELYRIGVVRSVPVDKLSGCVVDSCDGYRGLVSHRNHKLSIIHYPLLILFCLFFSVNAMAWSGGNGTAGNPYIIASVNELSKLNDTVSHYNAGTRKDYAGKYFKLSDSFVSDYETNYISFSIGYYTSSDQYPFCGSFDGNNKTLYQKRDLGRPYGALFAKLGPGAVVRNVVTAGSILAEGGYCAGIVAYSEGDSGHHVQIINCSNSTTLTTKANGDYDYTGGIAAYIKYTDIDKCCNIGNIEAKNSGSQYIGGLVGYCYYISSIRNSYNRGQVLNSGSPSSSTYIHMGGCVGYIISQAGVNKSYLENCYNIGDVRTNNNYGAYIGGIVGACNGNVVNCYNGGTISNEVASSAAITGYLLAYGEISNCYSRSSCGTKTGGTISLWGLKVYDAETPSDVLFFSHTMPAINDDCVLSNTILSTTDLCTALNNWRTDVSSSTSLYSAWCDDVSPWDNKGMPRLKFCTPISTSITSVTSSHRKNVVVWTSDPQNPTCTYSVSWTSSAGNGNSSATSPFNHTGLTNDVSYCYRVVAVGTGDYCDVNEPSAQVCGTPHCTHLDAPTLNIQSSGDRTVTVGWGTVSGAVSYRLDYGSNSSNMWEVTPDSNPYTVLRLTNGQTYNFKIKAVGDEEHCGEDNPFSTPLKQATPNCP